MKNLRTSFLVLLATIISISVWSCSDDDEPQPVPEPTYEELIIGTWKSVEEGLDYYFYFDKYDKISSFFVAGGKVVDELHAEYEIDDDLLLIWTGDSVPEAATIKTLTQDELIILPVGFDLSEQLEFNRVPDKELEDILNYAKH